MCVILCIVKIISKDKARPEGGAFFHAVKGVFFLNTVEPIRDMDVVLDVADYL